MAVNISWNGVFPVDVQGRPGVDPWYIRQATKPNVGLGGFTIGAIEGILQIPTSLPARQLPIKYETTRRQFPVIIPKGRLVAAKQIAPTYSAADQELGIYIDTGTPKFIMGRTLSQVGSTVVAGTPTAASITASISSVGLFDYFLYGEDWRFVMTLANGSRQTALDAYTTLDIDRPVITNAGDAAIIGAATSGDVVAYSSVTYPRTPSMPVGYVNAEVFADLTGQYSYFTEDSSMEIKTAGAIKVPYIMPYTDADSSHEITAAQLTPGGDVYDLCERYYAWLSAWNEDGTGLDCWKPLYSDENGNYILQPFNFTATATGVASDGETNTIITLTDGAALTEVFVGDKVVITTVTPTTEVRTVVAVTDDTTIVLDVALPADADNVDIVVVPNPETFVKVGRTMYYDAVGSKGLNWQIMTPIGSATMGTDTKGIDTRLYEFISRIADAGIIDGAEGGTEAITLQDLVNAVLAGAIGFVYIYVAPLLQG